ncbi:MAG TPA: hypothetical protein ENG14_02355 [Thermodesulforhabdus norvegica]|uniref:Uncharacterized protein n=1 Tax=Thermodesulforhabdus norvegica TaxID=39841 RepID=A0A7C1AXU9_9BACT|nr:hypothetical protein [Thermodesulforhabdus norvegica]
MLKALISAADFEKLDDATKIHYKKAEGTDEVFSLDVEAVNGLELTNGEVLRTDLGKVRKELERASDLVATFKDLDPAVAREALKKVEEWGDLPADKKAMREEIEKRLEERYGTEFKKLQTDLQKSNDSGSSIRKEFFKERLVNQIASAIAKHATPETLNSAIKVLTPHILAKARIEERDGKFVTQVIGDDGSARLTQVSGQTGLLSLDELAGEIKGDPDFAPAFGEKKVPKQTFQTQLPAKGEEGKVKLDPDSLLATE